jgi:hypothetical protein
MSNKLTDKVHELLREADNEVKDAFHKGDLSSKGYDWDYKIVKDFRKQLTEAAISFELVDRYGGEEQGIEYWSVYSFSDGMQVVFIKFDGWYASYDGCTYKEFYEVQAVEKTMTVYEKK